MQQVEVQVVQVLSCSRTLPNSTHLTHTPPNFPYKPVQVPKFNFILATVLELALLPLDITWISLGYHLALPFMANLHQPPPVCLSSLCGASYVYMKTEIKVKIKTGHTII